MLHKNIQEKEVVVVVVAAVLVCESEWDGCMVVCKHNSIETVKNRFKGIQKLKSVKKNLSDEKSILNALIVDCLGGGGAAFFKRLFKVPYGNPISSLNKQTEFCTTNNGNQVCFVVCLVAIIIDVAFIYSGQHTFKYI